MLARYEGDQNIYRARVERVTEDGGKRTVLVRFFDYGNASEVGLESLFPWESRYDVIKPQAVTCRLQSYRSQELSQEQLQEFENFMKARGQMSMMVHQVLRSGDTVSGCLDGDNQTPQLVVSLYQDGTSLEAKLRDSPQLAEIFTERSSSLPSMSSSFQSVRRVEEWLSDQKERYKLRDEGPTEKVVEWLSTTEEREPPERLSVINREKKRSIKSNQKESCKSRDEDLKKTGEKVLSSKCVSPVERRSGNGFKFPAEDIRPEYKDKGRIDIIKFGEKEVRESKKKISPDSVGVEVGEFIDEWDPMADDHEDLHNNYRAQDDKVEYATDWYQSRGNVCHFMQNTGHCYKGDFCEDRHVLTRAGAVTTDLEGVVSQTLESPRLPVPGTTVLVRISQIKTPDSFYLTLPHGTTNILHLPEEAKVSVLMSGEMRRLFERMQRKYQEGGRVLSLASSPGPGELVAARVRGQWFRARVTKDTDIDLNLDLFLTDIGRKEIVSLRDIRKLDSAFTILPFQAHEVKLSQVEPRDGQWSREASLLMKAMIEDAHFLTGKLVKICDDDQLVMEISAVLRECEGEEELRVDLGEVLCKQGYALRPPSIKENDQTNKCSSG